MVKVTNNHVGFGDFIHMTINEKCEEHDFIIDCGSNNKTPLYHDALNRYKNGSSFILSHFHDDHYGLICDSGYIIDTFYLRRPCFRGNCIDFIAVACMKIICQEEYESTSAWFIVNIIDRLLYHFNYNNIHFFSDNEIIWSKGKYSIRSIPINPQGDSNTICDYMAYFERIHKGLEGIIYKLSKYYFEFSQGFNVTMSLINETINSLISYRKTIINKIPVSIKDKMNDLFDKVVNNSSAVIGVYEYDSIRCLFLGDVDIECQKSIYELVGEVTLLKASHHGTDSYNSSSLLAAFNPQYILITYGEERMREENTLAAYFEGLFLSTSQNQYDVYEV